MNTLSSVSKKSGAKHALMDGSLPLLGESANRRCPPWHFDDCTWITLEIYRKRALTKKGHGSTVLLVRFR